MAAYKAFARKVDAICSDLERIVQIMHSAGRRVVGFGASAKGNTLLNRCLVPLAYIVDDNPMKHGYLTPGRNIPIRSPAVLPEDDHSLAVLLLAWNFAAEIIEKLRRWRPGRRDEIIHYVPSVRSHPLHELAQQ